MNIQTVFFSIQQLYHQSAKAVKLLATTKPTGVKGDHRGIPLPTCFGPQQENFLAFTVAGVEVWTVSREGKSPQHPIFVYLRDFTETDLAAVKDVHFLEQTERDIEHMLTVQVSQSSQQLMRAMREIENLQVHIQAQRQRWATESAIPCR